MKADMVLLAQLVLGQLGYGTGPYNANLDEKTQAALRVYEKNRKLPVTGDPMSFETLQQLHADLNAANYRPVSLPSLDVFIDFWDNGYFSAKGTWVLSNEGMAWPEQTSKIDCYRASKMCVEATSIVRGDVTDRRLSIDTDSYEIERWDEHEIVTKPLQFGCTRYVRRVNRAQKSVTGIRSMTSTQGDCKGIDNTEKYMVLSDGFEVYWQQELERRKKWRNTLLISPTLLRRLEQADKPHSK
jgi:Putative peptidoglycan binding domain